MNIMSSPPDVREDIDLALPELGNAPQHVRYVYSILGGTNPEREARAKKVLELAERGERASTGANHEGDEGASLYAGACGGCHDRGREVSSAGALPLSLAVAVREPDPASLIRIILEGIAPREGERGRWMPSFAGAFTDAQLVELVTSLRRLAPGEPPWQDVAGQIKKALKE